MAYAGTADRQHLEGRCLCGAVRVRAVPAGGTLRACHCDMCRRHTSSAFLSVDVDQDSLEITGPGKSYRSSDWAERGFCPECGSTLWYGTLHDGARHLAAGLFDNAAGGRLQIEYFADMCPEGYGFAGDHRRLSTEETIAMFSGGTA